MPDKIRENIPAILLGLSALMVVGYATYEARFIISGPELTVIEPLDNLITSNPLLVIRGGVKNISGLTIDGRAIMTTPDGSFSDKLLLANGYNTIEVKVFNKFGNDYSKILKIWLKKQ